MSNWYSKYFLNDKILGYVSFSAHADYSQILDFVKQITPKQIVFEIFEFLL